MMTIPHIPMTVAFSVLAVVFAGVYWYTSSNSFGQFDARLLYSKTAITVYALATVTFVVLSILAGTGILSSSGFSADSETYYDLSAQDGYYTQDYSTGAVQPYLGEEMGLVSDLTQSISMTPVLGDATAIMRNISQPQAVQLETPGVEAYQ